MGNSLTAAEEERNIRSRVGISNGTQRNTDICKAQESRIYVPVDLKYLRGKAFQNDLLAIASEEMSKLERHNASHIHCSVILPASESSRM